MTGVSLKYLLLLLITRLEEACLGVLPASVTHCHIVSRKFVLSISRCLREFLARHLPCAVVASNQCLSLNQGKESKEVKEESAEERLRRRAYERGCQRLKKRIEGL